MADTLVSSTYVYVHDNAQATATEIARATAAFAAFTTSNIDALVTARVDIWFQTPAQMASIPGLSTAAWGFTHAAQRICYVNNSLNSAQTKYVCVHELFHMVDHDRLSASDHTSLMAIMDPTASAWNQDDGTSGNTAYRHHPSECFADQGVAAYTSISEAPLQQRGGGDYYYRQIHSADYGTYRSIVGGGSGPTAITLAADAFFLDSSISLSSVAGLSVGDWLELIGGTPEVTQITNIGVGGPPTNVDIDPMLIHNHASGTSVLEVGPPADPGGPGDRVDNAIGIAGSDYTLQIDPATMKATESGGAFNGTFTFTIRVDPNSDTDMAFDDSFPWPDVYWNFDGYTLFGGVFMGATRRHGVAAEVYYDCRCVSYDSWLDRRSMPTWWTTDDRTVFGTPLTSDGQMIDALVLYAAPFLDTSLITDTNTSMPLLELPDGTVRSHISRIAEGAATSLDPAVRRAYVDFDQAIHYFEGSEGTSAPYSLTDQPAVESPVFLIPDYIEFDTDFNDSGASVYVNGTGVNDWVSFASSPYQANTIINRPEATDSDMLNAAGVAFLTSDFLPKYMVRFVVEGYHGWRAGQTVTILNNGLSISGDFDIRSIRVTPSPAGNAQITYDITAGAAPWRGLLDVQRKS